MIVIRQSILLVLYITGTFLAASAEAATPCKVLFIIADDCSANFGNTYGGKWIKTPNIDKLAAEGLVFDNVYTPTAKCAPSRAAILTGRYPWQLEDAANHQPLFPPKFIAFTEALAQSGVVCGSTGKTWGPGMAITTEGKPRNFSLEAGAGKSPGEALATFLTSRARDKPFFFWFGSHHPHRPYKEGAGIAAGKKLADIGHVPAYWPDCETVRGDMLDYAVEVEAFDDQVGSLIAALEQSGHRKDTMVIVTSDHGMPFPRVKGHTFPDAHRVPFVVSDPSGKLGSPRRISDFINFIDLAPTLLELFAVDGAAKGMSPLSGRSFTDLLRGEAKSVRPFVIVGRERNDTNVRPGSHSGLGYPVRAIREGEFFYALNFTPERWPCGDPESNFMDSDNGPTKSWIVNLDHDSIAWQQAFGKRPQQMLFQVSKDQDCMTNLANDPKFSNKTTALREKLMAELKTQNDPRALGHGEVFDAYESPNSRPRRLRK